MRIDGGKTKKTGSVKLRLLPPLTSSHEHSFKRSSFCTPAGVAASGYIIPGFEIGNAALLDSHSGQKARLFPIEKEPKIKFIRPE
jgi:hypothetical protein